MGSRLFVGPWRQIAQCGAAPPFFELPTGPLTRERPMRCLGHLSPRQHKEEGSKKLCGARGGKRVPATSRKTIHLSLVSVLQLV